MSFNSVNSFEELDKISSTILRIDNIISIKHMVKIPHRDPKDEKKKIDFALSYTMSHPNFKGITFTHDDMIMIESGKKTKGESNDAVRSIPPSVYINNFDAGLVIQGIQTAFNWLTTQENKDIYISDVNGVPIKLGKPITSTTLLTSHRCLVLRPCIVYDQDSLAYQGIRISNEKDVIADVTAQEFMQVYYCLLGSLTNLYSESIGLLNMAMLYYITKNLKGV